MRKNCKACNIEIISTTKEAEVVWCDGECRQCFHVLCAKTTKTAYAYVKSNPNMKWICDDCLSTMSDIKEKLNVIWAFLLENNGKFKEINERLEKISESGKKESYADKVKLKQSDPVIVVTPKDANQKSIDTRSEIKAKIDPKSLPVTGLRTISKGKVVIEIKNKESTQSVVDEAKKRLGDKYEVSVPNMKNPRVKIMGIYDEYNEEELLYAMKCQNDWIEQDDDIKIVRIDKSKLRKDMFNAVIEVDSKLYCKIMEEGKMNIGWSRCRVMESVLILRCFKCGEYGHMIKECKNEEKCFKCAGDHRTTECKESFFKCVNCLKTQEKLRLNLDVNHPVWSAECTVYRRIEERRKRNINYCE
jgi:hypothetical protein